MLQLFLVGIIVQAIGVPHIISRVFSVVLESYILLQ